jgi:nitrite reductase/ring-hydroxylating ferredoxin subunit/uncharacterized membrane protein
MRTWQPLEAIVERIEGTPALDKVADVLSPVLRKAIPGGPAEDLLSGTPAGHPLHPVLVTIPIGAWTSASVCDALGERSAARRLVGFGCLAAVPTALSGANDWLSTQGAERRVGLVHALLNYSALTLYGLSWRARHRGEQGRGVTLALAGAGVLSASGWLGGHLSYALGVGVDTTVFEQLPQDWTDAGPESALPAEGEIAQLTVGPHPLLVSRRHGTVTAMLDRCTHRGGPLHEGQVDNGCVTCPWHGSVFSLDDGLVQSGPATRPQPVFETRLRNGRLEVRRVESRSLRTNPVGP